MKKQTSLIPFIRHLKLEAVALALLMLTLTDAADVNLWVIPASFLLFDIGMLGYIINNRIGAFTYNLSHSLVLPTLCIIFGVLNNSQPLSVFGYCWTFHIALDRALGFGLKHSHSFHDTHLGSLRKKL